MRHSLHALVHRLPAVSVMACALATAGVARAEPPPGAGPGTAPEPTEWNIPGLAIAGVTVVGVGALTAVAGAVLWISDYSSCERESYDVIACTEIGASFGPMLLAGGGIVAALGTPMIVVGAWPVPSDDGARAAATARLHLGAGRTSFVVEF